MIKPNDRSSGVISRRIALFILSGVLLFSCLPGVTARADDEPTQEAGAAYSLQVNACSADASFADDLATANVVLDIYQIAGCPYLGTFAMTEDFASLQSILQQIVAESQLRPYESNPLWDDIAQGAAQLALDSEDIAPDIEGAEAGAVLTEFDDETPLPPGLYLVLARGSDIEEFSVTRTVGEEGEETEKLYTIARSACFEYSFAPVIVAVPTAEPDENGVITTYAMEWINDVVANLKPEVDRRLGAIRIIKTTRIYESAQEQSPRDESTPILVSQNAFFAFEVIVVLEDEVVFNDVFGMNFTGADTQSITIGELPVGAEITVQEIYTGAHYQLETDESLTDTLTAEEILEFPFVNVYDDTVTNGGGIVNHYENGEDGQWVPEKQTTSPDQPGEEQG